MADAVYTSIEQTPLNINSFTFAHILHYTETLNNTHDIPNTYTSTIIKGQRLFADRFVSEIGHREVHGVKDNTGAERNGHAVRAAVKAEMKKHVKYSVTAIILDTNEVKSVTCQCPGGATPACCKHAFAVLSAVEDYSRKELFSAPTEKLQMWHQPAAKKPASIRLKDITNPPSPVKSKTSVNFSALSRLPQSSPLFGVLPRESGTGCLLSDQLAYDKTIPLPLQHDHTEYGEEQQSIIPAFLDLNTILFYHEHVKKPCSRLQQLERDTMAQCTGLWHKEREMRLTASRVHELLHSRDKLTKCEQLLSNSKRDLSKLPPIQFGKTMEPAVKNMLKADYKHHIFRNTGLVVHPDYPFLGASPDGLLYKKDDTLLVEVKCVFNPKSLTLEQLCEQRGDFCLCHEKTSDTFFLKKSHKHFTQIQTQLFCSGVKTCLFVMFHNFNKPVFKQIIQMEPSFWNFDKLQSLSDNVKIIFFCLFGQIHCFE